MIKNKSGLSNVLSVNVSYEYVIRLNKFLNPYSKSNIREANIHDRNYVIVKGKKLDIDIPWVILNFDEKSKFQKCYVLSSHKSTDRINNKEFYFLSNGNKVRIDNPILVPNCLIKILNYDELARNHVDSDIKKYLISTFNDFKEIDRERMLILNDERILKSGTMSQNVDVIKAWNLLIDSNKVKKFCLKINDELEKDKLLLVKSKQSESGGSSGTPIEEGKNNKFAAEKCCKS